MGFSVMPVPVGGKVPAIRWKEFQERQPTDDELRRWFAGESNNVGIICGPISGIVVLDVDDPTAEEWVRKHVPETPLMVRTRRGTHRYYRYPAETVKNKAHVKTRDGELKLDVRGRGGYVLSVLSVRPDGFRYSRVGLFTPEALSKAPEFQISWLEAPAQREEPQRRNYEGNRMHRAALWMEKREPAIQGQRGDHRTWVTACFLVRDFRLAEQDAMDLMLEWNKTCVPPWRPEELARKVRGAMRGMAQI
jgi:hypothetical protein